MAESTRSADAGWRAVEKALPSSPHAICRPPQGQERMNTSWEEPAPQPPPWGANGTVTLWREALPADPMNTLQAEPWGSPATPEATSCSANPTPTSQGGSAAHEACRAGRGELLPTLLLPGRSPEVQTARLSLEACLRPRGSTILGLGLSPHRG